MTQAPFSRSFMASLFAALGLLMALAKMKPPLDWTQTHYLLSYDLGVMRRGLVGQLLHWVFPNGLSNVQTHWIAVVITALGLIALVLFLSRSLPRTQTGVALGLVILTSVPVVTYLGNTGYLDGLWLVCAIVAIGFAGNGNLGLAFKVGLCVLGVLTHEAMLSVFCLLVAVQVYLASGQVFRAALPVFIPAFVAAALFWSSPFADEVMRDLIAAMTPRAVDWDIRVVALEAVMRFREGDVPSFADRWTLPPYLFERGYVLPMGLAYLFAVLALLWRLTSHRATVDRLAIVAVGLAPLAILFVAFDLPRFLALTMLQAWLIVIVLLREDEAVRARFESTFSLAVIAGFFCANIVLGLPTLNTAPAFYDQLPGALLDVGEWAE